MFHDSHRSSEPIVTKRCLNGCAERVAELLHKILASVREFVPQLTPGSIVINKILNNTAKFIGIHEGSVPLQRCRANHVSDTRQAQGLGPNPMLFEEGGWIGHLRALPQPLECPPQKIQNELTEKPCDWDLEFDRANPTTVPSDRRSVSDVLPFFSDHLVLLK